MRVQGSHLQFGSRWLPETQHLDEEFECGGVDDEREYHETGDIGETPRWGFRV